MAFVVKDRVKETCTAPGTGTVTLLGASTGYQSFSVIGNSNTTYYCIADQGGSNWEVGIGTYTSSGTTLSRDTVLSSSNGGAKTNFSTGTQDVFVTYPSERSVYVNSAGSAITPDVSSTLGVSYGGTGLSSLTTNYIPYGNGTSAFQSSASLTFDGTYLTAGSIKDSALTSGRVTYAGASGLLTDSANLTFDGTTITVKSVLKLSGSSSGYVALQGAAAAGSTTYTLPSADGTNGQFLTTNGSATLSWATGATASTITNDTTTASDVYPAFMGATSGTVSTIYTSNAKLLYKPSTGEFKASAPVASNGILVNNTTVAASYTIASGSNGLSVGPMTVNSGITVTVSSGQRWLVL